MYRPAVLALALVSASAAHAATVIQLLGRGTQTYTCAPAASGHAWTLKAPEAVLTGANGAVMGRHFAGPTWQAADGSTVTGQVLVASPAPQATAIPWLVLAATAHLGAGMFANVAYITRSLTEGGVAPAGGCDAAHAGREVAVSYQATYVFFPSRSK